MLVTNPFTPLADLSRVTRYWWVLLVSGIISVVAGGIILFNDWKLDDLAVFIGALLVFRGLSHGIGVPLDGSGRAWTIVSSLLEVALGVMVWVWPSPTLLVIAFWLGWYVLLSGIMTIAGAVTGRDVLPFWGFMLALGMAEVLLAFWLLNRPGITLVAAVMALGLWTLIYGAMEIVIAFDVRRLGSLASTVDHELRQMAGTRRHANA